MVRCTVCRAEPTAAYGSEQMLSDLALVNEIPLYAIPDDVPFTLDQHLAFQRLTEALPRLIAERDDLAQRLADYKAGRLP